jgi:hypothetical protein
LLLIHAVLKKKQDPICVSEETMRTHPILATLALALALAACTNSGPPSTAIGPTGGSLTSGDATLTIPSGALQVNSNISLTAASDPPATPEGLEVVSGGLLSLNSSPVVSLGRAAQLAIRLKPVPDGQIPVFRRVENGRWVTLTTGPGVIDNSDTITASITSLGTYGLFLSREGGVVGNGGKTLSILGGKVALVVPAGTFAGQTGIYSQLLPLPNPDNGLVVGQSGYTLTSSSPPAGTMTLRLSYDAVQLPAGSSPGTVAVGQYVQNRWIKLTRKNENIANTVSAEISEFGTFGIVVERQSSSIGNGGGVVPTGDGNGTLTIPVGALASTTQIFVTAVNPVPAAPDGYSVLPNTVYSFDGGTASLAQNASLNLRYDAANLPAGKRPVVSIYRNGSWQSLPAGSGVISGSGSNSSITVPTAEFGTYGVLAGPGGVIGSNGGTISAGNAQLVVPNGAFATTTAIDLTPTDNVPAFPGFVRLDRAYIVNGATNPQNPLGLVITHGALPNTVLMGSQKLYRLNGANWTTTAGSTIFESNNKTGDASIGYGTYAVFAQAPQQDDFSLAISGTTSFGIARSGTVNVPVSVTRQGNTGNITIEVLDLPSGVTSGIIIIPSNTTSGSVTLTASNIATVGSKTITVRATAGGLVKTAAATLNVTGTTAAGTATGAALTSTVTGAALTSTRK